MDRTLVYPSSIPLDSDILQPQQDAMVAIGYALQAAYGNNTVFVGLACGPTAPASMTVNVGPGAVVSANVLEATPFGSLPADTTDPLVKMGVNITSSPFTLTAPSTSGQSQNFLIQGTFSEGDDTPATLIYFNSLNPNQPYSGPNNSGTPQNTRRAQRVNLQLKVGVPGATGTQVTPPVDSGWTGLYVITVPYGATSITGTSISVYPNAPFLAAFLSSHHGGVPGQAPKINLATEVQGVLSPNNLPTAVGSSLVYGGNPNGYVAGSASSGATPPTMCWDTVNLQWWTCVTTGSATSAVWSAAQNALAKQIFTTSGSFTVPAGVTHVRYKIWGAGGGGGGCASGSQNTCGSSAGGGGYTEGVAAVTPGQVVAITVGAAGTAGTGGNGGPGGTSSFGSFASATGGGGGVYGTASGQFPASFGAGGNGVGGQLNVSGESGGLGWAAATSVGGVFTNVSAAGGGSFGSAQSQPTLGFSGNSGTFPGGGGSGGSNAAGTAAFSGGPGAAGLVVLEWY